VVCSGFGAEDVLFAREAIRGGAQEFLPKILASPVVMQRAILASIERKRQERRRVRFARHDELTGLANHALLGERFERAVARAERQGRYLALLSIELDHYLNVVEQMGSVFGDRVLCAVAARLQANFRRSDTLARLRPRGFTALLEALVRPDDAGLLAGKLRAVMAPAFRIDDSDVCLTASVGIALFPIHGHRLGELTGAADAAMFEVAIAGGNGCRVAGLPAPAEVRAEFADDQSAPP
jgi:diguanylate cyclase (GGDEF)-like protein